MDEGTQRAVITVGGGRGFIVETAGHRLVVTAAHCLPHFPPAASITSTQERTYVELLGPLGNGAPKVGAECLFADPIGDIAVLGSPDCQEVYDEAVAYEELTEDVPPLRIADAPERAPAWLLTLDRQWIRCEVKHVGGPLWIENAAAPIMGGMSGSPILDADGGAIGVLCASAGTGNVAHTEGGPNPRLSESLPGWLLRQLAEADATKIKDDESESH